MDSLQYWNDPEFRETIRDRFVTGKWIADHAADAVEEKDDGGGDGAGEDDVASGDDDNENDHGITVEGDAGTAEDATQRRLQDKEQLKKRFDVRFD